MEICPAYFDFTAFAGVFRHFFAPKNRFQEYFATKGILRPKPKAFELIRKMGGA